MDLPFALRLRLPLSRPRERDGHGSPTPLVPAETVAGRALVMVIAIMTFLAAVTTGAVAIVRSAAQDWQSQVAREVTIQVRPLPGRDLAEAVRRASALAQAVPGITEVRALSRAEIGRLLEPWLGQGLDLDQLPAPQLIVLRFDGSAQPDLSALSANLMKEVPSATLDDHRLWLGRLQAISGSLVALGGTALALVLAATALSILFATRGAMSGNRDIVEVLHVVGARDSYVARVFAHRFLVFGFKGAALGAGAAIVLFLILDFTTAGGGSEAQALLGHVALSGTGYAEVLAVAALIAALTAATSRLAVLANLRRLD